jgi:hypothetical protein
MDHPNSKIAMKPIYLFINALLLAPLIAVQAVAPPF